MTTYKCSESTQEFMLAAQHVVQTVHGSFPVTVGFARKGVVVALVSLPLHLSNDGTVSEQSNAVDMACILGGLGYAPDEILFSADGFTTSSEINPITKKEWKSREVYDIGVNDGGLGGVVERAVFITQKKCKKEFVTHINKYTKNNDGEITFGESYVEKVAKFEGPTAEIITSVLDATSTNYIYQQTSKCANAARAVADLVVELSSAYCAGSEDMVRLLDLKTTEVLTRHGYCAAVVC